MIFFSNPSKAQQNSESDSRSVFYTCSTAVLSREHGFESGKHHIPVTLFHKKAINAHKYNKKDPDSRYCVLS